jgi:alpha-1,2-mannosyltransferase
MSQPILAIGTAKLERLNRIATIVAVLVVLLFAAKIAQTLLSRAGAAETDLITYVDGAARLRAGLPLYTADIDLVRDGAFRHFIYPPPLALLFTIFPNYAAAWWGWGAISIGCWLGALALLLRELGPKLRERISPTWWPILGAALVNFPPVIAHLFWGQLQLPLLLLLLLCWLFLRRGRDLAAGTLLGVAIALKIYPLLLLAPLLIQRRWRAAGAALLAASVILVLSFLAIGWEQARVYFTVVLPEVNRALAQSSPGNNSIAVVIRNATGSVPFAEWSSLVIRGLALGAISVVAWRRRHTPAGGFAAGSIALVIVPPVVWEHYFVLLYLPWLHAFAGATRRQIAWLAAAYFFIAAAPAVYHAPAGLAVVAQALPLCGAAILLAIHYVQSHSQRAADV